jgi:hypothetical protein
LKNDYICLIVLLLSTFVTFNISAQKKPVGVGSGGNIPQERLNTLKNDATFPIDSNETGLDSTVYKYILTEDIYDIKDVADSLAGVRFMRNYTLSKNGEYIHTGNYGAAVQSLIYNNEINTGFALGYNQYRLYQVRPERFKFYEQNRPLSDVFFSQLGNQENIMVGADFSRNFSNGLSISLNYNRISQKGLYNGQDTKSTGFGIGVRYKSANEKYNAFLIFTHNANEEGHIGGIVTNSTMDINEFRRSIPVILQDASTRHQERSISLVQYYKLNSVKNKNWNVYIRNDAQFMPSYYKYTDKSVPDSINNSFYYGLNNDVRGLRRFVNVNHFSDGFYVHGEKVKGVSGKIGLVYDLFQVTDEPKSFSRSDLTATFEGKIPFLKSFEILTKGKLGLLANAGNFDILGKMNINVSKFATLDGGIKIFRSEASYRTTLLNINDQNIIDTTFSNPFGTVLFADLSIPKVKFSAGITQSIVSNPIFWPQTGAARQFDGVYTMTYLKLAQNVKLGRFHLDNQVHFQLQNNNIYPLPDFFSSHQIYYAGKWFKKVMDISIGLDARLIPEYKGPTFQPLFGSFNLSDANLPFFPASNLFILIRISSFRAMFMMENFSQYFRKGINFDVVNHPQFDPKLRMGFRWLLKD